MEMKLFLAVFGTVFLAELGDKTQLATMLFAADQSVGLLTVFLAASLALIASTSLAVMGGALVSQYVDPRFLSFLAGGGFVLIGFWTIWHAYNAGAAS